MGMVPDVPISLWLWRYRDARSNSWKRLSWRMTEQDAATWAARHVATLEKVANSEERGLPSTALWNLPPLPRR